MKVEKQYEEQIIKSLNKVPFEMKKIKFILFLAKYFNRLKREKATLLKIAFFAYTIIISILYFTK
jgi:cell division protein FtsW (lipid II flippase)